VRPGVSEQRVDLGRADKVVLGQALDGVGRVAHQAAPPADLEIRVMVLRVGDPRDCVDEPHRLVKSLELELAPDLRGVVVQAPVLVQLRDQPLGFLPPNGTHAGLAGQAALLGQFGHGVLSFES
jgi:hypothetical protein